MLDGGLSICCVQVGELELSTGSQAACSRVGLAMPAGIVSSIPALAGCTQSFHVKLVPLDLFLKCVSVCSAAEEVARFDGHHDVKPYPYTYTAPAAFPDYQPDMDEFGDFYHPAPAGFDDDVCDFYGNAPAVVDDDQHDTSEDDYVYEEEEEEDPGIRLEVDEDGQALWRSLLESHGHEYHFAIRLLQVQ
jgi:hypothetical protein